MPPLRAPATCRAARMSPECWLETQAPAPWRPVARHGVTRARLHSVHRGAYGIRTEGPAGPAAACPAKTIVMTDSPGTVPERTHQRDPTCGTFCHDAGLPYSRYLKQRFMIAFRPLSRRVTAPLSILIVIAWVAVMAVLAHHAYLQASGNLATDLARYGSSAQWRGVYYRGEKLGFTVSQTLNVPADEELENGGFELQEDGQLQMALLGAHT